MRLHQTPSRPTHAGCNRFVILEDVHNSCAVRCRTGGHFFRFEASGCPLPTTAPRRRSPGAQTPYGQPRHGVLSFQVSRRICGHHRPSATMETGMRYQADIDALRLRRHWQLSPPGSLSGLTCRRWRLPAAHQMRPPCNGQLGRYCRRDANWATQPSQLQ